ncbi:MAG: choice-of-anchor B family protein [Planctomycetota bacterium]|nr:choice-of-anchor B family protein [Planctomycetota bacterium]
MLRSICAVSAFILGTLVPVALAHDDDPKILDKQPPYVGRGYRQALVAYPGHLPGGPLGFGDSTRTHSRLQRDENGSQLAVLGPETSFSPGIEFASDSVQLLSWLTLDELGVGTTSGNDCWGYVSPSGREYALIGTSHATVFVDVSQPDDAQVVAIEPGPVSLWRDIKTYQTYAYSVSEGGGGIQVFDLSQIDAGTVTHLGDFTSDGTTTATHNVVINEDSGFLYRSGGSGHGLRIYSLANPASPSFVNSWDNRYVHDAQVVTYTSGPFAGREIAFCASGDFAQPGLDILDVTNKNNIVVLDQFFYPNPVYSHQVWLNEAKTRLYLNDELDEGPGTPTTTHVINVSNLNNPSMAGTFDNGLAAVGHNVYIKDGLLFEANYRSGLRVFDIDANPTNPPEIAWFDVYPQDDLSEFNGLWSIFPFFPSGTVIGSDLEKGLFVWRLGEAPVTITPLAALPDMLSPDGFSFDVTIGESQPGDFVIGSAQLHYDVGKGWASAPLTNLGGGNYRADLPAMPCGLEVPYYISALSSDGITWTSPSVAAGLTYLGLSATDSALALFQNMQSNQGWTSGAPGDNATTGIWERGNPIGSGPQAEDDHSPGGTDCWFTGQGSPGGSIGENDVDGGSTTLLSPVMDLSDLTEPNISYWRWYVNTFPGSPDADDVFFADISNDGGSTWTNVETLDPTMHEQAGAWIRSSFRVADYVKPTSSVRMRFVASDLNNGSIVEAALDDFSVTEVLCPDCNGNGTSNGMEILGGRADRDNNGIPDLCEMPTVDSSRPKGKAPPPGGVGSGLPNTPGSLLGDPPTPPLLSSILPTLSVSGGGEHVLRLEAGLEHAGQPYLLLGSFSGTSPGFALPQVHVPLQFDAYTRFGIHAPNTAPLRASRGTLDSSGRALSFFTLPADSNPALVGLTIHHAFLVFDDVVEPGKVILASNPTPLQLID